jgi:hypothetical protein
MSSPLMAFTKRAPSVPLDTLAEFKTRSQSLWYLAGTARSPSGTLPGRSGQSYVDTLHLKDLGVGRLGQANASCVNGVMPGGDEVLHRPRRHRHVDQEPHTENSIVSSSARLAA